MIFALLGLTQCTIQTALTIHSTGWAVRPCTVQLQAQNTEWRQQGRDRANHVPRLPHLLVSTPRSSKAHLQSGHKSTRVGRKIRDYRPTALRRPGKPSTAARCPPQRTVDQSGRTIGCAYLTSYANSSSYCDVGVASFAGVAVEGRLLSPGLFPQMTYPTHLVPRLLAPERCRNSSQGRVERIAASCR